MNAMKLLLGVVGLSFLSGCISDRGPSPTSPLLPSDVVGLPLSKSPEYIDLTDGDTVVLEAAPVKKSMKGKEVRMWAYNGSIPGPILRARQNSTVVVRLRNRTGLPTSLHAHGVRMDFRYDGTANFTQDPVADGESFTYHLRFPDAGLFWYHPHIREDYSQELGLYGNILVQPADRAELRPVDREQVLMLDDFYLDSVTASAPFRTDQVDRTMMGRFGNVNLMNGDTVFRMEAKRKELVRFYLTNASNSRTWNIGISDSVGKQIDLKVVGSDNGAYEWFDLVRTTYLAPGERKILEVRFDGAGTYRLTHFILKSPYNAAATMALGRILVSEDSSTSGFADTFLSDSASASARRSIDSVRSLVSPGGLPDQEILLTGIMSMGPAAKRADGEPISLEAKGIEWVDHMSEMNARSNLDNMKWVIRDVKTGRENHGIQWTFTQGDKVKIRIRNDTAATHPMPHPIHFHGQRFLITAVNGRRNLNMAWKDTYLIGTGETTDILLDASNPGQWMAHCHIAEHLESLMMFHFTVEPRNL